MSNLPLQALILSPLDEDWTLLREELEKQGYDVVQADCIGVIYDENRYAIIFADHILYQENHAAIAAFAEHLQASVTPVILLAPSHIHDEFAKDPYTYDCIAPDEKQAIIARQCRIYCKVASREWQIAHSASKNRRLHNQIANQHEVSQYMYDKIAQISCFDSVNIDYHYNADSLFKGDVFIATRKPSGDLQILLADFNNQGLSTAIGALPTSEIFFGMTKKGFCLESIIREINKKLYSIMPRGLFCSACLVEINVHKTEVKMWNGGMPSTILTNQNGKVLQIFPSNNLPLGIETDEKFNANIVTILPEKTDSLFLCGNRVLELENNAKEPIGEKRFQALFKNRVKANTLLAHIGNSLRGFSRNQNIVEGITFLRLGFESEGLKQKQIQSHHNTLDPKPADWSMELLLPPHSLRSFDPLPILLHIMMEKPELEAHRSQLYAILAELFSNALDHGVLGLDSKEKADIGGFTEYYRKRNTLLESLENAFVKIKLSNIPCEQGGRIIITIEDSGEGFDYQKKSLDYKDNNGYSGRGMPMIRDMCENVRYYDKGNCVEVIYHWT